MEYTINNNIIEITVTEKGAELKVLKKINEKNILWCQDEKVWGFSSPVLFPFVGKMKNDEYVFDNKKYNISQHGFARRLNFDINEITENEISFKLQQNQETLKVYPFNFELICGYKLESNKVIVYWEVKNNNDIDMPFFIGAHPAFVYNNAKNSTGCFIKFHNKDNIVSRDFLDTGYVSESKTIYNLENNMIEITNNLLNGNTIVLENNQVNSISLLSPKKEPYVKVDFDSPLVGIWSKKDSDNIFVCIEPWYGRCDSEFAQSDINTKDWINIIKPGEIFIKNYLIEVI